jgi:SAM-dependent methyltransferase
MSGGGFQDHWLDIDPERMERYETMFRWNPATAHYYAAAAIGAGHAVADFGCGPGHAAIEFARQVGATGSVHALDINEEFVRRARARAAEHGLADRSASTCCATKACRCRTRASTVSSRATRSSTSPIRSPPSPSSAARCARAASRTPSRATGA